ncbi:Maltose acetyltransferase [Ceratobasidium sp. 414]|nr:Maltose acetyltransferase [Ceratobasidium sp. 414]
MSEARVRSKTGCLTCKNRKKKCDETRLKCLRCKRAGIECLGYSYLDNPVHKPRKPRTKRNTPVDFESPSVIGAPSQSIDGSLAPTAPENASYLTPDAPWNDVIPSGGSWSFPPNIYGEGYSVFALNVLPDVSIPSQPPGAQLDVQDTPATWWNSSLGLPGAFSQPIRGNANQDLDAPSQPNISMPLLLEPSPNDQLFLSDTSNITVDNHIYSDTGQAGPFQRLLCLDAPTETFTSSSSTSRTSPSYQGSVWPSPAGERDGDSTTTEDDSDTEGVMSIFGPTLALDRGVPSNALPYVISTYLRWVIRTTFEPLKAARQARDNLTKRYMHSDDSRCGTTLIASVADSLIKNRAAVAGQFPAMAVLEYRVNQKLAMIKSSREPLPDAHASDVLNVLHDVHEMISVQCLTKPLSHFMKLLRGVVPVYQEACSEPLGVPIHLPAKLLHPESVLRHFPSMDILISFGTSQPMLLRYDVTHVPDLCERIIQIDNIGLQWMNGVPDHFLVMLARMNMLREEFAPNVDPQIVQELEAGIDNFKPTLDESPDSYLKVARLMVQESWRQVMYIYLYMVRSILAALPDQN